MLDKYFSIWFISKKTNKMEQVNVKASSKENVINILIVNDLFLEKVSEAQELTIKPNDFIT
jgi:hypothetical protein